MNINENRCDGLEHLPVQNIVLLPFIIGVCILRMTPTCQRLARTVGLQLTSLELVCTYVCERTQTTTTLEQHVY